MRFWTGVCCATICFCSVIVEYPSIVRLYGITLTRFKNRKNHSCRTRTHPFRVSLYLSTHGGAGIFSQHVRESVSTQSFRKSVYTRQFAQHLAFAGDMSNMLESGDGRAPHRAHLSPTGGLIVISISVRYT